VEARTHAFTNTRAHSRTHVHTHTRIIEYAHFECGMPGSQQNGDEARSSSRRRWPLRCRGATAPDRTAGLHQAAALGGCTAACSAV
jgi:hypothetical protein